MFLREYDPKNDPFEFIASLLREPEYVFIAFGRAWVRRASFVARYAAMLRLVEEHEEVFGPGKRGLELIALRKAALKLIDEANDTSIAAIAARAWEANLEVHVDLPPAAAKEEK